MSAPKRIQRRRTKGWRMPEGAIYVGRPSKWSNPFTVQRASGWPRWGGVAPWIVRGADGREWEWPEGDKPAPRSVIFGVASDYIDGSEYLRQQAVDLAVHLHALHIGPMGNHEIDERELQADLGGHDLVCWCPLNQPCHADALLEIANRGDA